MKGIDSDTCDEVSLKLSGLIGIFDLMVDLAGGDYKNSEKSTMVNFAFYISKELQSLYKTVSGADYRG
jgi:hypothetical protein